MDCGLLTAVIMEGFGNYITYLMTISFIVTLNCVTIPVRHSDMVYPLGCYTVTNPMLGPLYHLPIQEEREEKQRQEPEREH